MKMNENFNKKLLVEGKDDQHVIWALCKKSSIEENFDIIDSEGFTKLKKSIPVRLKQSDIEVLGIIIDADENLKSKWDGLRSIFEKEGYTCPPKIPDTGLIMSHPGVAIVGIWIMPNNNLQGELEDFIIGMIPDNDNLLRFAEEVLNQIEQKKHQRYNSGDRSKAQIYTWLAWQDPPGRPLGQAITNNYLSMDKEISKKFIDWLQRLFGSIC